MIYNKKGKLNKLKTGLLLLLMVLFALPVKAQTNVYQHSGTQAVTTNGTLNYYDSGGASSVNGDYYWEHWYKHNENSTLTFKNGTNPVKVSFNHFTAWDDDGTNAINLGQFALRINNDHLYVYEGETADEANLIVDLTGTIKDEFSIMAQGPITFKFVSDRQYRDEGWAATVTSPSTGFAVPLPLIAKETCSDVVYINNSAFGAKIYYTTNGDQPTIYSTEYTEPFAIDLDPVGAMVTVKAIAIVEGVGTSGDTPAQHTFLHADQRPLPGVPTISFEGNIVKMTPAAVPAGLNDTYYVRYTTDGSEPSATNGTVYSEPFEWHTPNTTFKAITQATDCPDKISTVVSETFGDVTVPSPVISFDASGNATITCSFAQASIYYTTNGSEPTTSSSQYTAPFAVTPGTTVKAFAHYGAEHYLPSAVVSKIYVPEGGSGTYNGVVLLDDREDHSWSYYSDKTNPIRSLNPADVKITYFGNGTNNISTTNGATPAANSWNQSATTVQVSYNETANQFVYLKTLERADGATSQNPTGNCAYTTIPNPFSKRPTYQYATGDLNRYCGFYGWRVKSVTGGSIQNYAVGATIPAETEIQFVPAGEYGMEVELEALWARAYVVTTGGQYSNTAITSQNVGYERNFVVLAQNQNYYFGGNTAPRISNTGYAATISRRYPDGNLGNANATVRPIQSGYGYQQTYAITLGADTKFEYMAFSNLADASVDYYGNVSGRTLDANGHNLIVGRGVTNSSTSGVGIVIGNIGDSGTQTIRLESGYYSNYFATSNSTETHSGVVSVKTIFGNDYDRADNNNANLTVAPSTATGHCIYGGASQRFTSSSNKDNLTFDWNVKSGKYHDGILGAADGGDQSIYLGSSQGNNSLQYIGKRRMTIEGGEFASIAGGMNSDLNDNYNNTYTTQTAKDVVTIRVKGGTIRGAIYGAAAFAGAAGGRTFVITGGTINGWIAGGCNGTRNTGGELFGSTYIYVGGKANVVQTTADPRIGGTNNQYGTNGAYGGNIFGAGCGIQPTGYDANNPGASLNSLTVGKVYGSNVVIADDATIGRDVYGGGNFGLVADGTFGSNTDKTANVYILGGTINGKVFGGSNNQKGETVNIVVNGEKAKILGRAKANGDYDAIDGSVYGGSNNWGTINEDATITVSNGTIAKNVFGGGFGSGTTMAKNTIVNVSGGTINNNVYGGGEQGTVTGNTEVTISGGTMHNVYGAGLGTVYTGTTWPSAAANANIAGTTTVSVSGGTMDNVYGGGENGSVAFNATATSSTGKSTVNVSGGEVTENVFGGGKNGTTQGATIVNVSGGNIRGNVFGGALGAHGRIYVNGMRTVNMTDGHVYGNVYGGSRNANDGNDLSKADNTFSAYTGTEKISVTNISGGIIDQNVYAAGYYGSTFGSVYVFIGKNAINNAPFKAPTDGITYNVTKLNIGGSVWAGGDWGTFSGQFGGSTVSGNSNIYVDGTDYETETTQTSNAQYMNIGGSVLGCGTSCHAGKNDRTIVIRNYGHADGNEPAEATRTLFSIQFAKTLIIDNSNINFTGQGRINSLVTTEKYGIYEIANGAVSDIQPYGLRLINGGGLFLNAPVTQIANFKSMQLKSSYADIYAALNDNGMVDNDDFDEVTPTTLPTVANKVRVNNGTYVEVKYVSTTNGTKFGPVIGYTYMMAANIDDDATCAYARPRWCYLTQIPDEYNNPNDGGWISYTTSENTFALDGNSGSVQMPYENHTTRSGEDYFRIWRVGGTEHYREDVFDAAANGTATFSTVDVTITLPAFRAKTNYYRFETTGDGTNTTIDYGPDVLTFNAANYAKPCADGNWMYYDEDNQTQETGVNESNTNVAFQKALTEIKKNPDVNFGLVAMPGEGLNGSNYIICSDADNNLANANTKFGNEDNTEQPQVTFRLTYYNKLSSNMTWDPMTIVLVQCDANGNPVDRVTISLAVNTSASIEQEFSTKVYAIMQGKESTAETFNAKVVLPMFSLFESGEDAKFTLNSVDFESANDGVLVARGGSVEYDFDHYAVDYAAGLNYDNTSGWSSPTVVGDYHDTYPMTAQGGHTTNQTETVGYAGGRQQFAIDFTLHYNGHETADAEELIGTLTYNITFSNYKKQNGVDQQGNPIYVQVNNQPLKIVVEVYRRGTGNKFYLDGVNGSNSNSALFPNDAVKSLSTIFNRCGYLAGDEVYVVNKVTATNALTWNGLPYNNVTLYRYNGGHKLKADPETGVITPIVGNENNDSYKGELLVVNNRAILTGITLDGYYEDPFAPAGGKGETPETSVQATAPLITVNNGGIVELSNGTVLNNNYNTGNGGAVYVNNGGTLMMNMDAQIKDNVSAGDGAGVYMAGNMIVSDDVKVFDNKKGTTQNNVLLTAADKVITIGTDATTDDYAELGTDAKIGVTKELYGDVQGYTKVVNVESNNDIAWLETPYNVHPNSIIYHDLGMYQLEKFSDPTYLYWIGTWVTVQYWNPKYESNEVEGYDPDDMDYSNIDTPEELAWLISMVNGENGATPNDLSGKTVNITADIDMNASIWVPIGSLTHPFKGTFEGNGHVITGMRSPLVQTNMAMFGNTDGATIQDMVAKVNFDANSANMGTLVGTMTGGTLSNVEAAGVISGGSNTVNMGGLVGNAVSGTIHSAFAVNEMTGSANTVMGGLVGTNGADLYNSYANVTMTGSNTKGGLVGVNNEGCTVENCYVVLGQQVHPAFAYTNKGSINYCYVDKAGSEVGDTEGSTGTIAKSGTYAAVQSDIKHINYMYRDNKVTAADNEYVKTTPEYLNNHTVVWDGLLSVLNQWVAGHSGYTPWFRPINNKVNGDLPVLAFPKDNSMATTATDGKFLQYAAYDLTEGNGFNNGIDGLLANTNYANIFLYGNATEVANVPAENVKVTINEDAVLLQADEAEDFTATVGVTFDNSEDGKHSWDYYGNKLEYDWHMMSSSLKNALIGATYEGETGYGKPVDIKTLEGSYFPDGLISGSNPAIGGDVKWDFYTYFEPEYHWINLKRSGANHWHTDGGAQIQYLSGQEGVAVNNNETIFVPGKGYMMAINQDTYMNSTGVLNSGNVKIKLTQQESQSPAPEEAYNEGWNLVGNPYQAYLKMSELGTLGYAAYTYDADKGVYVPFVMTASTNPDVLADNVHPHQAFFVHAAKDGDVLEFTPEMATTEKNSNSYFRDGKINYPLVNLYAENEGGSRDLTVIELHRPELGGVTKMQTMRSSNFIIAAHLDGQSYGLVFTPEGTERIPVHFIADENGTYTLRWNTQNGEFTSLRLVDNLTGTNYDMLANDHYTFTASTEDYASRFYITYTVTDVDENVDGESNFAYFDGTDWVINGQGTLDVVDVLGRTLFSQRLTNDQNRVNLNGVAKGVYLLRVSNGKNTMVQKIVVR